MQKIFTLFTIVLISFGLTQAQIPTLAPSIGLSVQPQHGDPICNIPVYLDPDGTYETPGLANGQLIPDFTLYDRQGNAVNMQSKMAAGKPVLIVSGSYTCPVFRNKVNLINNLKNTYGNVYAGDDSTARSSAASTPLNASSSISTVPRPV